ncbi:MAG TPA: S26 family signal peptidase [Methanospirillum sp.]|nr:S26 family signal peptidase [Methanospirillum sp.]
MIPPAFRETIPILASVGATVAILFILCGTWPVVVVIEHESMVPNLNPGDLVIVMASDRMGPLQSMAEGTVSGYEKFGLPGDVIIYRPNGIVDYPREVLEPEVPHNVITDLTWNIRTINGLNQVHPLIQRAIVWVDEGEEYETNAPGNQKLMYTAPHAGFITKGDNNHVIDQVGFGNNYRGIGSGIGPVKPEWIIGKAVFTIPYVGMIPSHINEIVIIVIIIVIIHELFIRLRKF